MPNDTPDAWRSWITPSAPEVVRRYIEEIAPAERLSPAMLAELRAAAARGDEAAILRLIKAHLQLVVYRAKDYAGRDPDLLELIQQGNIGLVDAVGQLADKPSEIHLTEFVTAAIRASIERHLAETNQQLFGPIANNFPAISQEHMVGCADFRARRYYFQWGPMREWK